MVSVYGTLVSRDPDTFKEVNKKFSYINPSFVGSIALAWKQTPTGDESVAGVMLPYNYQSYWAWANAVFRGLNSLSNNTYVDSLVGAVWSLNEENAG